MKAEYIHLSLINVLEFNGQLTRFNILFNPKFYPIPFQQPACISLVEAFDWSRTPEGHVFWQNLHEEANINQQGKYIGGYILLKFSIIHE